METTGLYVIAWLFLILLAILWFFLPFAIFGVKPKLDALIAQLKTANAAQKQLVGLIAAQNALLERQRGKESLPAEPAEVAR